MAIITRSFTSNQATSAGATKVVPGFTNGGILLSLNATWYGLELIDITVAGTIREAFKSGDVVFRLRSNGVSLISSEDDAFVVTQGGRFVYSHPERDDIIRCDFMNKLRPGTDGQGLMAAGANIEITTQLDPVVATTNGVLPGAHRLQMDATFMKFE